ncbi:MAG: S9 family peptidase [Firmicutes bacterium]|nr:S9 family peptidase [Bacillota bacterium]
MKRKIVAEDICALNFVGDAQLAPDGRVAYVLTEVDRAKNGYRSALWSVMPGAEPVRLTYGQRADGGLVRESRPRWRPGGGLSFVSNRQGKPQVFLLEATEGEARQLTTAPEGVSEYVWSPDGRYLAFVSKDPEDEEAAKDRNPDVRHITHLRYKFNGVGFTDTRKKHLHVLDLEDGSVRRVTDGDFDVANVAGSPDGARLAFSACIGCDCELHMIPDIWVVNVDGSNLQRLTQGKGAANSPVFSPDGTKIAYFGHEKGEVGYANNDLWVIPASGGQPVNLTEALDRSVGCSVGGDARMDGGSALAAWTADGEHLFVTVTDGGTCHLYRVGLNKEISRLTYGEISITSFSHAVVNGQDALTFIAGSVSNPGDVYLWQAGETKRLTAVNEAVMADWQLASPERFTVETAPGWEIEGWIMKPIDFTPGEKYPLILHIHGGPHATYGYAFMHEFQLLAAKGYGVLYTNPRGSRGYGEEFTKGVVGDWGGGDYVDLMGAVDYALKLDWVDESRLGVTGGSYGGYMTNWIVTQTDRFKAAVTLRSISNIYTKYGCSEIGWYGNKAGFGGRDLWDSEDFIMERSPIRYAPRVKTPILIIHSEEDYRCPMEQAEQWYVALKRLGVTTEFVRFAGENHELSRSGKPRNRIDRLNFILGWFQRFV